MQLRLDPSSVASVADLGLARTTAARSKACREATALLAANDNKPSKRRVRYRGGRPALAWLAKRDAVAAAALWLLARYRLPEDSDNIEPGLTGVDTRDDGTPRGPRRQPVRGYLELPAAIASSLRAEGLRRPIAGNGWWNAAGFAIKPQREIFDFHPDCRHGFCAPEVADGAMFLGSIGGLGKPKKGKQKGDPRRIEGPDLPEMPDAVLVTVEAILARATLSGIGETHGYSGGYADRAGKRLLIAAGQWAKKTAAEMGYGTAANDNQRPGEKLAA